MAEQVDEYFTAAVTALPDSAQTRRARLDDPVEPGSTLSVQQAMDLFNAQLGSRHLDLAARWLRSRGKGFYTIGSSGHEGNVAVAAALRPTDPALLHYRSWRPAQGLRSARSPHHPADLDDRLPPSASGRGRLLHRPGRQARIRTAVARRQHRRLQFRRCVRESLHRARSDQRRRYKGVPTPILFVCEDNGIGISTKTAPGWIASTFGARAGLEYFAADG